MFLRQNVYFALLVALPFVSQCYCLASVISAEFSVYMNAKLKTGVCDAFAEDSSFLAPMLGSSHLTITPIPRGSEICF